MQKESINPREALSRFGRRLRQMRVEQGLSQERLALLAEIDRSYLGGIERGEHNVALLNVFKISRALGVPVKALFDIGEHHV